MVQAKTELISVMPTSLGNMLNNAMDDASWDELEEIRLFASGCL